MGPKAIRCLLFFYIPLVSTAHAEKVGDLLNQQYRNQVLALRVPFTHGGSQDFDFSGKPLNPTSTNTWLVYGGILVHKVKLSRDTLVVEGPRAAFTGRQQKGVPAVVPLGKSIKVQVHLDHPLTSVDDARLLLERIFFPPTDIDHAKPQYRRSRDVTRAGQSEEQFFHPGKEGVKWPRAVYTPEPDFSEQARHARYQGTVVMGIVVDEGGSVEAITIEKALGEGLDENAVEAVKHWRFNPATRDGQPVPVSMQIEVSFNLY